jgi:hypothetical protein
MQRKDRAANAPPAPPMSGMMGLGGMPITAPTDYEIANSLGYKDPNPNRFRNSFDDLRIEQERAPGAKQYLDSINYGQAGFDPSKYEGEAYQQDTDATFSNLISRQLNEQYKRDKASGMLIGDISKGQDKLEDQLYKQYNLRKSDYGHRIG